MNQEFLLPWDQIEFERRPKQLPPVKWVQDRNLPKGGNEEHWTLWLERGRDGVMERELELAREEAVFLEERSSRVKARNARYESQHKKRREDAGCSRLQ